MPSIRRRRGEAQTVIVEKDKRHTLKSVTRKTRGVADYKGDHERAITNFDKAIQLSPENTDAYVRRSIVYGRNGNHDRTIADFDKAIQLDPLKDFSYFNRGAAYYFDLATGSQLLFQ